MESFHLKTFRKLLSDQVHIRTHHLHAQINFSYLTPLVYLHSVQIRSVQLRSENVGERMDGHLDRIKFTSSF